MTHDEANDLALDAFAKGIYAKNIEYNHSKNADLKEFDFIRKICGSPGQVSWICQQSYAQRGVQIQVQKEVSDDLFVSDFAPASKFDEVVWPAKVCEIYFEDPALPTFLLMKATVGEIESWFPGLEVKLGKKESEYVSAVLQEGRGDFAKMLAMQLKPEMYDAFLNHSEAIPMGDLGLMNSQLTEQDHATFAVLVRLALKVFAFASIPHFKPQPIYKKQMHHGGKPDFKGRPRRPAVRVLYLPEILYKHKTANDSHGAGDGGEHKFLGRRGHFRFYRAERYVNMKGKWDYIRPIPGPDGKYPKFDLIKIRNPK